MKAWFKRVLQQLGFGPDPKGEDYWAYKDGCVIEEPRK